MSTLRSAKLHMHYNELCRYRKLCYVLIALKNSPQAREDLRDQLTEEMAKLEYYVDNFTPASNQVLFNKQLVYIQLFNTIRWFLDDSTTVSDILGVNFEEVYDLIHTLLKVDYNNRNFKELTIKVANIYTGIYYTTSSLENASTNDCESCTIDINHYGMGRKYNLCMNNSESDPELPSQSFTHLISPNNVCAHLISHEEIHPLVLLLKFIDDNILGGGDDTPPRSEEDMTV